MTCWIRTRASAPAVAALRGMVLDTAPWAVALAETCTGYGLQAPRDISSPEGLNQRIFGLADAPEKMNLCDIQTHTKAEDKDPGLDSCFSEACTNGALRAESQVFPLANDPHALDFADFTYAGQSAEGYHRAGALPTDTGKPPVVFAGSTTGPDYTAEKCSPFQVTWSVRPNCAKLDISSLHRWGAGHVFEQDHSHGVRQLVTAPELLAPMQ